MVLMLEKDAFVVLKRVKLVSLAIPGSSMHELIPDSRVRTAERPDGACSCSK